MLTASYRDKKPGTKLLEEINNDNPYVKINDLAVNPRQLMSLRDESPMIFGLLRDSWRFTKADAGIVSEQVALRNLHMNVLLASRGPMNIDKLGLDFMALAPQAFRRVQREKKKEKLKYTNFNIAPPKKRAKRKKEDERAKEIKEDEERIRNIHMSVGKRSVASLTKVAHYDRKKSNSACSCSR